jgi:hypothetical protein
MESKTELEPDFFSFRYPELVEPKIVLIVTKEPFKSFVSLFEEVAFLMK